MTAVAVARITRKIERTIQRYVGEEETAPVWTGPVERRDPTTYQKPSEHLTWLCRAVHCRSFTMYGAYKVGRCNFCNEPRGVA